MKKLFFIVALLMSTIAFAQTAASKVEYLGETSAIKLNKIVAKQGGLLEVQAEFYNDYTKQTSVFYRTKWLDENGFEVWEDEAWKPFVFQAFATNRLKLIAPTPKARDFKIQLSTSDATRAPRDRLNQ